MDILAWEDGGAAVTFCIDFYYAFCYNFSSARMLVGGIYCKVFFLSFFTFAMIYGGGGSARGGEGRGEGWVDIVPFVTCVCGLGPG